jgi:hypothetical protein
MKRTSKRPAKAGKKAKSVKLVKGSFAIVKNPGTSSFKKGELVELQETHFAPYCKNKEGVKSAVRLTYLLPTTESFPIKASPEKTSKPTTSTKVLEVIKTKSGSFERLRTSDGKNQYYRLKNNAAVPEILIFCEPLSNKADVYTNLEAVAKIASEVVKLKGGKK